MTLRILLPMVALVLVAAVSRADLLSEVPQVARDELAEGQLVIKSNKVPGAPWPELQLYQVVNAPPKVVWNLFNDYSAAPSYTPGLLDAKVVATNPDGSKDVQYTVRFPILQRISYTVRNTYQHTGKGSYEVSWTLLQSPLAKSSSGSLRVQPYGKNQTLLCYTNLVVPITNLVSGLKNEALNEAKTTVRAITTEAERRASGDKS